MPYVLSKLSSTTVYNSYTKAANGLNIVTRHIEIMGGADVTDKNLIMPNGVVTRVSDDELAILQNNKVFQKHVEGGYVKVFKVNPNVDKEADKMPKDNSKQLTPSDYKKNGKKAPNTEKAE